MSERAFVCELMLLNIDTYSNILIESSINTNEMYSRVNEKLIYVIDITFGINESIFSGNEQQKVYQIKCVPFGVAKSISFQSMSCFALWSTRMALRFIIITAQVLRRFLSSISFLFGELTLETAQLCCVYSPSKCDFTIVFSWIRPHSDLKCHRTYYLFAFPPFGLFFSCQMCSIMACGSALTS